LGGKYCAKPGEYAIMAAELYPGATGKATTHAESRDRGRTGLAGWLAGWLAAKGKGIVAMEKALGNRDSRQVRARCHVIEDAAKTACAYPLLFPFLQQTGVAQDTEDFPCLLMERTRSARQQEDFCGMISMLIWGRKTET